MPRPPIAGLPFHRRLHAALAQYHHFAKRDGMVREEKLLAAYATIWDVGRAPSVGEKKSYQPKSPPGGRRRLSSGDA